jgi:hypothetical protein
MIELGKRAVEHHLEIDQNRDGNLNASWSVSLRLFIRDKIFQPYHSKQKRSFPMIHDGCYWSVPLNMNQENPGLVQCIDSDEKTPK